MGDRCTVKGVKESDRSPDQCAGTRGAQAKVICQEKKQLFPPQEDWRWHEARDERR